ncbi:MAG: IS4 family transposase, partial [Candidatus Latescibacteria bacterium]|nr:IS4 family transposase [Candidatus Latescibacterota bacterium]
TSLTMDWADYRNGTNKAIAHVGFDLNRSIPMKIHLHTGKSDERPYMFAILDPGQTCVTDRYYQRCRRHHYHLQTALEH